MFPGNFPGSFPGAPVAPVVPAVTTGASSGVQPITSLSGTLATVVVAILQQFGVPMTLRRTTIHPSDFTEPRIDTVDYPCRGTAGVTMRKYDKGSGAMERVLDVALSNPGTEPRANDQILAADGRVLAVITPDSGIAAVRPDFVTTILYQISIRVA